MILLESPTRARDWPATASPWYGGLNRAGLPAQEEAAIGRSWEALGQRVVASAGWWDRQLGL